MREAYLVLESHRVRIAADLAGAIKSWESSTRISPIYLLPTPGSSEILPRDFDGVQTLFLLGPVPPYLPLEAFGQRAEVWLSLGSFNVLVRFSASDLTDQVVAWAVEASLNYEMWHVENGIITRKQYSTPKQLDVSWREDLASLSTASIAPELVELVKEYCPLMASALARSGQVLPEILPELREVNRFVVAALTRKSSAGVSTYEGLKMLTLINAGLSRFTSQAFSGTSPVNETECHFWTHSLLGTAVANVALWRFCGFVLNIFGQEAIPRRVAALSAVTAPNEPMAIIDPGDEFWFRDYLASAVIDEAVLPLLPPITYFSGRDGFRSTLYSLSAPLAVIGACNSLRWTLLTLTHEISHNVIRAVLGKLYPRPIDRDLDEACKLVQGKAGTLVDSIRQHLIISVLAMQQMEEGASFVHLEKMRFVLDKWHNEVEEIMVHVFDFLYFYEGNHEKYIREIWLSWSVIPNIGNRVPEYVLRTLCAVLALHLRRGSDTEDAARDQVRSVMENLSRAGGGGQYIEQAILYLDSNWDHLKIALVARRGLVQIVRTFLYSDAIAAQLRFDEMASGGAPDRQGYHFKHLEFSSFPIRNPLRFIDGYTSSAGPSVAHSLWMLYMLAFNVRSGHGEE